MDKLLISDLVVGRGGKALNTPLSHSFIRGKAYGVVAPNGAGKTTLLRTLAGLLPPIKGHVSCHRSLFFLGIYSLQAMTLTVEEMVAFWKGFYGAQALPTPAFLTPFSSMPLKKLSQGQRQLVCLSQAIFSGAKLWVLDEPFVHLDEAHKVQVTEVIKEQCSKGGAVIFSDPQKTSYDFSVEYLFLGRAS